MAEIQSESTAVIGNRELREDMLHKLKKEFDIIHEAISKNQMARCGDQGRAVVGDRRIYYYRYPRI